MLKFLSFGSGSSGNCYLLFTDTDCLMIDCGVGIRTLKKHFHNYGLQLKMVHNMLITHDHADHVKSVGSVSGDFKVTPFEVPHDSTDCVGYSIEHNGIRFTLITDCGHITEEIAHFISISNYLVIEANHEPEKLIAGPYPRHLKERISGPNGHLSNEACAQALVENASPILHHVWLCHLSDENNHPELAKKTIETVLRDSGIVVGKDFMVEVLKRKIPSELYELNS